MAEGAERLVESLDGGGRASTSWATLIASSEVADYLTDALRSSTGRSNPEITNGDVRPRITVILECRERDDDPLSAYSPRTPTIGSPLTWEVDQPWPKAAA